jgi:nicotinamidase-related amidase
VNQETTQLPAQTGLMIIDVQRAIDDPKWTAIGPRNNIHGEANIAALLAGWRRAAYPIIHVRHDSTFPASPYRPGQPGNEFKEEARPNPGELVVAKRTNSAFIGTELESMLRASGIDTLVIAGVVTNNSVESTVRMSGNLGFKTYLVEDACWTFARLDYAGHLRSAEEVHAMSLANMDPEYCTVLRSDQIEASSEFIRVMARHAGPE